MKIIGHLIIFFFLHVTFLHSEEILPPTIEPIKAPIGPAKEKPTNPPIRLPHILIKKILTDVFNFIYIFGAARETRTLTGKPHLALKQVLNQIRETIRDLFFFTNATSYI